MNITKLNEVFIRSLAISVPHRSLGVCERVTFNVKLNHSEILDLVLFCGSDL